MFCNVSQNVLASQTVALFPFVEFLLGCFRNYPFPLRYQRSDCGVDLVFLSYVQTFFHCSFKATKVLFQLSSTLRGHFSQSINEMKSDNKSRGLGLQRKNGFCIKLDKFTTEIGMCLPIQNSVSVSFKFLSSTLVDSKSKMAMLLKSFGLSVYGKPIENNLSDSVSRS